MLSLTSPIQTYAHRLPAGLKLALLCGYTILLFALKSPAHLGLAALPLALCIAAGGAQFARVSLHMLRPLLPFIVIVALWHLITQDPGGGPILIRMITAVAAANFVTMTTRLSDMIAVIEKLARPLSPILPPKTLALAIALTIRFTPTLLIRAGQIAEAWRARSPKRPGWRVLLPTTLAALDDADRVAEALRARGGST
ncbi:energy-coupling factor transporter transmembrane component T [Cypionkella sp.]|uniref:energy-coupling factor transporter transmembrane component T family protein n=1 Tax=Cypionkella sp. TaxID=2811411 RepID=UPI002AB978A9|nr:energy-coupling factor transporter transmembrane component T [Cypionkella sp.]MDZ4394744.1 energy-coupling factor transporter transmembrane component T [Cypionkella sp.]